jgi:competence protein ComEC
VRRRTLAAGDVITLPGPVRLTVLSPAASQHNGDDNSEANVNEQSLVFRLSYGAFSMLFCADAGFEAEQRMLDDHAELKSSILKVGHHGSRFSTSEQFLDHVRPQIALISAGAGNRFGLPAPRTVTLLQSRHIPLYRTDRDGTIELITDGKGWSVSTPYAF